MNCDLSLPAVVAANRRVPTSSKPDTESPVVLSIPSDSENEEEDVDDVYEPTTSDTLPQSSLATAQLCQLTDRRSVSTRSAIDISNVVASTLSSDESKLSYGTMYRKRKQYRSESLAHSDSILSANNLKLSFDGKKLFGRERLAVLGVCQDGQYFHSFKTFRTTEKCTAVACSKFILESIAEPKNVLCLLADTTSLNSGRKGGIFAILELHFKRALGQDLISLECLFHVLELLFYNVVTFYDGDSTAPNALQANSVYNLIKNISPDHLQPELLMPPEECAVKPIDSAREYLSNVLDYLIDNPHQARNKLVRDDIAVMLVLACSTFRRIPPSIAGVNYHNFLYRQQEIVSKARWITTCNGYLRLFMFRPFPLSRDQQHNLNCIVKFALDVYVPGFFKIFNNPSAVHGPKVVLGIRDFLMACGEIGLPAKSCFLRHASTWMNPKVVAIALHDEIDPPVVDVTRLAPREVDTSVLLWSNRPLKAFFSLESSTSPCVTSGTPEDWRSFKNNQQPCERLIGYIKTCLLEKRIRDSSDNQESY